MGVAESLTGMHQCRVYVPALSASILSGLERMIPPPAGDVLSRISYFI